MIVETESDKKIEEVCSKLYKQEGLEGKADYLVVLKDLNELISIQTASSILGVITGILGREISVKEEEQNEFLKTLEKLIEKLQKLLPENLKSHIPEINVMFTSELQGKTQTIFDKFKQIIIETLVKNSKYEIWNCLNLYFNKQGNDYYLKYGLVKYLLRHVSDSSDSDKLKVLREIAYLAQEADVNVILEFFEAKPAYFNEFLIMLLNSNRCIYEKLSDIIQIEKKYYRKGFITALPVIEFEKIKPHIKDYNWEVTAELIEYRPYLVEYVMDAFQNGEIGITKKFLMDAIVEQDTAFSTFIRDFSFDELLELGTRSLVFIKKCYLIVDNEEQMLQFCKVIAKRSEAECLNFIEEFKDNSTFELFLSTLLKITRLTGELKNHVVSKYSDDPRFFYSLISYMSIETIERLLEKHYKKQKAVESLLRRFYPQELIIEVHRFRDLELARCLIIECVENPRFDDKDWVLAMKSLENLNSPINTSTALLILQAKPRIRSQVIHFLKKSIGKVLWETQTSVADFIKCLEFLKEDCVFVFDSMKKEEIVFVLRKSSKIECIVRKIIDEHVGDFSPNLQFIRNCLRSL
ncbi:hypothetical protein GINT2_000476 [Glugoides intestinalis]